MTVVLSSRIHPQQSRVGNVDVSLKTSKSTNQSINEMFNARSKTDEKAA